MFISYNASFTVTNNFQSLQYPNLQFEMTWFLQIYNTYPLFFFYYYL